MKLCVTVFLLCLFPIISFGQKFSSDTLVVMEDEQNFLNINSQKIDSLEASFTHGADSLKQEYHQRLTKMDSVQRRLESKLNIINSMQVSLRNLLSTTNPDSSQMQWKNRKDSLTLLNRYSEKVSDVLDSIRNLHEKTFSELNSKVESLKQKTVGKLADLNLPPQLYGKVSEVASQINGFKFPASDFKIPELGNLRTVDLKGLGNGSLADVPGLDLNRVDGLNDIGNLSDVAAIGEGLNENIAELNDVTKGNSGGIGAIESLVESHVEELSGVGDIKGQTETLNQFKDLNEQIKSPDSLKEYAIEQAKEIAIDHFAGKEEQLTQAMQTLARYKSKYPNLNSMSEATRRPPNEMKGKPLIERIVPGIALQVQKKRR